MKYDVIVMGSINMDLLSHVDDFPEERSNVIGHYLERSTGGKGSNQAATVAKQGVSHTMVGAVGNDPFGHEILANMKRQGIDTNGVIIKDDVATGTPVGIITKDGSNTFIGILGANMAMTAADVDKAFENIEGSMLLLQLETSRESVLEALKVAHDRGMTIVLDPAPSACCFPEALAYADIVTPNLQEAEAIADMTIDDWDDAKAAAKRIADMGVDNVVVKFEEHGSVLYRAAEKSYTLFPARRVKAVNTTGAGDVFAGVLASLMSRGVDLDTALKKATIASSIKVFRNGGQDAIPTPDEIEGIYAQSIAD